MKAKTKLKPKLKLDSLILIVATNNKLSVSSVFMLADVQSEIIIFLQKLFAFSDLSSINVDTNTVCDDFFVKHF